MKVLKADVKSNDWKVYKKRKATTPPHINAHKETTPTTNEVANQLTIHLLGDKRAPDSARSSIILVIATNFIHKQQ